MFLFVIQKYRLQEFMHILISLPLLCFNHLQTELAHIFVNMRVLKNIAVLFGQIFSEILQHFVTFCQKFCEHFHEIGGVQLQGNLFKHYRGGKGGFVIEIR